MEAPNKKIEDWFSLIKQGQVVLPRFQRHEAGNKRRLLASLKIFYVIPPCRLEPC